MNATGNERSSTMNMVLELTEWEQGNLRIRRQLPEADPIWGEVGTVYESDMFGWVVRSHRSGSYVCSPRLREQLARWQPAEKARLTTWITDQNRLGESFPALIPKVIEEVHGAKPLRFSTKLDRFFKYLASIGYRPGDYLLPSQIEDSPDNRFIEQTLMRWTEAATLREWRGLLKVLIAEGLILNDLGFHLSGEGLTRLDEASAKGAANDQAFVAMWFDPSMEDVYERGIMPGLADVGYQAFRIDRKEHANKIDDEIIAEIRRTRFLVADFTCGFAGKEGGLVGIPRGGVYYEAGFAQGLGMPVIWMVRHDQVGLVHFDTRQFNHIVWSDPDDLRMRLARRVGAVLGDYRAKN